MLYETKALPSQEHHVIVAAPRQQALRTDMGTRAARVLRRQRRIVEDDMIVRCTLGPVSVSAVRATHAVKQAQDRWGWDVEQARLWGSHAAATLLAASFLSGEERVRARLSLQPSTSSVMKDACEQNTIASTEALALGEIRGRLMKLILC